MSTLRQRIKRHWDDILVLIDHENCGADFAVKQTRWPQFREDDFRPVVVAGIRRIAEAEVKPAYQVRADLATVAKAAKKLRSAISQLPPNVRARLGNSDAALRPFIEAVDIQVPVDTDTTITLRKKVAARVAFDLLTDYGTVPNLTDTGAYIKLAALLYRVAADKKADLAKPCTDHFDALEAAGQPVYSGRSKKGRDGTPTLAEVESQGLRVWRAAAPTPRQQRASTAALNENRRQRRAVVERLRDLLPLDPVLDAVL